MCGEKGKKGKNVLFLYFFHAGYIGKRVERTRHRVLCTLEWADEAGKFHIHKAQPIQSVYNVMHIALMVCVCTESTCSRGVEKKFVFHSLPLYFLAQHNQH